MSNYQIGREFEKAVEDQFKILEERGLLEIVGRNVRVPDKDGNMREIDILLKFIAPIFQVEICVECKRRHRVKIEVIDKIRSLRGSVRYKNFMIVTDDEVSEPTRVAAENENIPIFLFMDLKALVEKVSSEHEVVEEIARMKSEGFHFKLAWTLENEVAHAISQVLETRRSERIRYLSCLVTSGSGVGMVMLRFIAESRGKEWSAFARDFKAAVRPSKLLSGDTQRWNELRRKHFGDVDSV